ncbi:hypothetical protein Hanom_Chr02g00170071 [Helianthus anomalus]
MDYGGNHVLRTVSDSQPAVIGIDGSMSIINMHHFLLCTCWLCVNYFELYMLYHVTPPKSTRGAPPLGGVTDQDQAINHIKHSIQ